MTKVTLKEAVNDLLGLIRRAQDGEEIVIVDNHEMLAKLEGIRSKTSKASRRKAGLLRDTLVVPAQLLEPMTESELREFWGGEPL